MLKETFKPTAEQVEAVEILKGMPRYILADGTGLGKTMSSISSFAELKKSDPKLIAIVIATKSGVTSWRGDLKKHTNINFIIFNGSETGWDGKVPDMIIITYSQITKCVPLVDYIYQNYNVCLIIDEYHRCKNPKSDIYKVAEYMIKYSSVVWGLTATPVMNNLIDLYTLFDLLFPGLLGNKTRFWDSFINFNLKKAPVYGPDGVFFRHYREVTGYKNLPILAKIIEPYYLRRSNDPVVNYNYISVALSAEDEEIYLTAASGFLDGDYRQFSARLPQLQLVSDGSSYDGETLNGDLDKAAQKEIRFLQEVQDFISKNQAIVIYTCLRITQERLRLLITKYVGVKKLYIINGDTPNQDRELIVKNFSDGDIVLMTEAGGESINLQIANHVIFYNLPFSMKDFIQVVGRIVRLGSRFKEFFVSIMESEGTIDTYKKNLVYKHTDVINKIISGDQNLPKDIDRISQQDIIKMRKELLWKVKQLKKRK